ncbi:hypothetical protein [Rhodonellum sp.]|uniref:hypothetical protein n=1 Tax=Rhodonellum sp. TaxID=2231180 RepID=UPI00271F77AE|nr:hypothetical protein [Rhodonellum sp.]MDO9554538.1 hypothetical protein [Rhodonellum sp.]
MPIITIEDLSTHIYPEGMAAISREDDNIVQEAIDGAITEASMYLTRYNTEMIYESTGDEKKPYAMLITYIKDIAKWHFIAVANVSVDLELAQVRYEKAIKGLIMISKTTMAGWPLLESDFDRPFRSGSNTKFNHEGF